MDIADKHNKNIANMIRHVDDKTTDQADKVMTVPASNYLDDDQFQREMEGIFKRVPIMVALTQEISETGDYKAIKFMDSPLLIVRQKDGTAKVMLNVCSHRAMLIASDTYGNKTTFSCPYHGWTYNCDGRLRGISDPKKFGDIDRKKLGLTELPSYERAGLIFAVLTPGQAVDFEAFFEGMLDDIETLNFAKHMYCGSREMQGANWKVAFDGYLEGYHFAAAHPETIFPRSYSNIMEFDAYGPHLLIGFPQRSIHELKGTPPNLLHENENKGFDFIRTLFPNISIFVAPEVTQIAQLIPGPRASENKTILYFLHNGQVEGKEKEDLDTMIDWIWKVVEQEDYGLGLKVQQGLESGAVSNVVFGRNERGNQYFHRWVNYYLSEDVNKMRPSL